MDAEIEEVRGLLSRLGRRNPIRMRITPLLDGALAQPDDIEPLLAALATPSDRRWRERAAAAWALGQADLSADQAVTVSQQLCDLVANSRAGRGIWFLNRLLLAGARTVFLVLVLMALSTIGRGLHIDDNQWVWGFVLLSLIGLFVCCLIAPFYSFEFDAKCAARVRAMAVGTLGRLRQPQSVWALAEACCDRSPRVRWKAFKMLPQVLPSLHSDHYGRLDSRTVPALCRALKYESEPFLLAVLDALGKVGDGRAVVPVEHVARTGPTPPVRTAAERILPLLRERQRQENDLRILLRPSAMPADPAAALLRPAAGTAEADSRLLLRSHTEGNVAGDE